MAARRPSLRVMLVCSTMVVRPECSGVQTARTLSPRGIGAKKLVLLSIVAVAWLGASEAEAVIPPMMSASAMMAPPCMTSRRLHRSSRLVSSASLRSGERVMTFTPMNLMKGEASHAFISILGAV
jgi:hypothetical protein